MYGDEEGNKVFAYQFSQNKNYLIGVQGYSAQFPPSEYAYTTINVNNIEEAILTENGEVLTDEVYKPLTD